jgi:3-deoxy-D-arabino-heptulosonate 7-phosphate (DAHP) synthase class II
MAMVTTFTIMSVSTDDGTYALTSKVTESVDSALDHLRAMSREHSNVEPVYDTSAGWRWTWEGTGPDGTHWSDTVRIY